MGGSIYAGSNSGKFSKIDDSETECLRQYLAGFVPDCSVGSVCESVLEKHGSLGNLFLKPDTTPVCGSDVPEAVFRAIGETRNLLKAVLKSELKARPVTAAGPDLAEYCRMLTSTDRREQFHLLLLDKSKRLLAQECLQTGTVDHVNVYPREVMKRVLEHQASRLILVHNHPSGNSDPSQADIQVTRMLQDAAGFFGVEIEDHIIISDVGHFSFKENGLLALPSHCISKQLGSIQVRGAIGDV